MSQFMIPLLQITVPPQVKGIVEIEVETIITARVVSVYQLNDPKEGPSCHWNLDPQFLSCFGFPDDFHKITLWRFNGKFELDVQYEDYDTDEKDDKIPGSEYIRGESLDVTTVREVQSFPSVE